MELVKDLPEIFDEFEDKKKESFLKVKEYKDKGIPVIGAYCSYFPREIALAVGAVPIGLCSSSDDTIAASEKVLPKNVCPLVKSSYGFAVTDKCPFFYFSDLVVGETTCDGKKKMYELLREFKQVYVMELPSSQSEAGYQYWRQEIIRFKEYVEEMFHEVITEERLRSAIKKSNRSRVALKNLYNLMKLDPVPMMGRDLFKIIYGSKYQFDLNEQVRELDALVERMKEEYAREKKYQRMPRILITGCPIGGDSAKVVDAIENNGGVVVAYENCTGAKAMETLVDEEEPDVYMALSRRYLSIGCSVMTPNDNRIELLSKLIDEYHVDAVVDITLQGCLTNGIEAVCVANFVHEEKHIPYMEVATDFSKADVGQLNTRMAAFIEMLPKKE